MNSVQNSQMFDVLDVLEACTPVIYHFARSYEVDAEDLLQDVALSILADPRTPKNPAAYYTNVARHMAQARAPRDCSLDAPAYADAEVTLVETLPTGPIGLAEDDHSTEDKHASIVYAALQRLPADEQEYFCATYGINAYTPTGGGMQLHPYPGRPCQRSKRTISTSGYRHLRRDQELLRAVQEAYSASAV